MVGNNIGEQLTVYYPSGKINTVFGRYWQHGLNGDVWMVAIEVLESSYIEGKLMSPGSIALVDPRCVVVGAETGEHYTPKPYVEHFPKEMQEYMAANPDWPSRLKLK